MNKRQLSDIFGLSEATLTEYQRQGLPIRTRGQRRGESHGYDTVEVYRWLLAREIAKLIDVDQPAKPLVLERERARLAAAQANRTEREVALMDGRLLDATRVEQVWYAMVANFRQRMLALPAHVAHLVARQDPEAAHDVLERAIHEALRELADYDVTQYAPAIEAKATRGNGASSHSHAQPRPTRGPDTKRLPSG